MATINNITSTTTTTTTILLATTTTTNTTTNGTNVTTNGTAQYGDASTLHTIDMAVLMTSCIVGCIANIFVPYLILTVRRLKTVTNVFVFSICLCNVFVGEYCSFRGANNSKKSDKDF